MDIHSESRRACDFAQLHFRRHGELLPYSGCQPFPASGRLAENMDLSLPALQKELRKETGSVYTYVVTTIKNRLGHFYQLGSGPNFQGDLITLCTCKHQMRAYQSTNDWPGHWIAGFTSAKQSGGQNHLVYLMRVGQAFESQRDLWNSDLLSMESKAAKAAHLTTYGDLYEPLGDDINPFNPGSYRKILFTHSRGRNGKWREDIDYSGPARRASLLAGDPSRSYLWRGPSVVFNEKLSRGIRKESMGEWLKFLQYGS